MDTQDFVLLALAIALYGFLLWFVNQSGSGRHGEPKR